MSENIPDQPNTNDDLAQLMDENDEDSRVARGEVDLPPYEGSQDTSEDGELPSLEEMGFKDPQG